MTDRPRVFVDANISDLTGENETTAELRCHIKPIRSGTFLREVMGWTGEALSAIERRRRSDLSQPFWEEKQAAN